MKKVLLLCVALVLTACAKHKEEQKEVRFEKGAVLSDASEKCSMEIVVKSGQDVILKKSEKCLKSFVVAVNIMPESEVAFDYSGVISDQNNPDKVQASIIMFSRTLSYKVLTTSQGDVLEVPVIIKGGGAQRAILMPGKSYTQHVEGLDFSITMNK